MSLLNWDGTEDRITNPWPLRDVVENIRQAGALGEMLGRLLTSPARQGDSYDTDLATEFMGEAGALVQALGARALALLDAQAAPGVPPPTRKRRKGPRLVGVAADGSLAISRAWATSQAVPRDGA